MSWYLRSMGDRDTHHGGVVRPDGTVAADCGVEFEPLLLPLGSLALRGGPADPRQVCPKCVGAPQ